MLVTWAGQKAKTSLSTLEWRPPAGTSAGLWPGPLSPDPVL